MEEVNDMQERDPAAKAIVFSQVRTISHGDDIRRKRCLHGLDASFVLSEI